jgi:hypothetical protein
MGLLLACAGGFPYPSIQCRTGVLHHSKKRWGMLGLACVIQQLNLAALAGTWAAVGPVCCVLPGRAVAVTAHSVCLQALLNILVYSLQASRAELGPQVQVSTGARSRALNGAAAAAAAPRLAALAQDAERKGAAGAAYVF